MNDDLEALNEADDDEEGQRDDPGRWPPSPWLTEPYAILRVHVREYYRLQRARIRGNQQLKWLIRWYPTIEHKRLEAIRQYADDQHRLEDQKKRVIAKELLGFPLWTDWCEKVEGIGPILMANILGQAGPPERFKTVSAYWRYWGAAVVDGRSETAQAGEVRHFSRYLKTARWKLGKSFTMVPGPYRNWYLERKEKEWARAVELNALLLSRTPTGKTRAVDPQAAEKGLPPGSVKGLRAYLDMRTRRWTVKLFLSHTWEVARTLANLPTGYGYAIGVLGHPVEHHIAPPHWSRPR